MSYYGEGGHRSKLLQGKVGEEVVEILERVLLSCRSGVTALSRCRGC